jgi:hypothetical protein
MPHDFSVAEIDPYFGIRHVSPGNDLCAAKGELSRKCFAIPENYQSLIIEHCFQSVIALSIEIKGLGNYKTCSNVSRICFTEDLVIPKSCGKPPHGSTRVPKNSTAAKIMKWLLS